MEGSGRTLVVGFGSNRATAGFAVTQNLPNYELKRRMGEWESAFVGSAGHLQYVIPAPSRGAAETFRDQLNDAPAKTAKSLASARTLDRDRVGLIDRLLKTAVSLHGATGRLEAAFNDFVWEVVDGQDRRAMEVVRSYEALLQKPRQHAQPSPSGTIGDFSTFPFRGVIFDLDQTLVDSSALHSPSARQSWAAARDRDPALVKGFATRGDVSPQELPGRIADHGIPVAVVTRSPRAYCDIVCEQLGISAKLILPSCGEKTAAFQRAAVQLGLKPREIVVVGDDRSDFQAARRLKMWSVGALWTSQPWEARYQPEAAVREPTRLLTTPDWYGLRYLGECEQHTDMRLHAGSLIAYGQIHALGRYFASNDPRHDEPLSRAIIAGKRKCEPEPQIVRALERFANRSRRPAIDLIVSVPPHPGQADRFVDYRELFAHAMGAEALQPLRASRQVGGYKWMSPVEKHRENSGRFSSSDDVVGARVVLLDDVVTTGSVLLACREALTNAGATEVHCLAFALTQGR